MAEEPALPVVAYDPLAVPLIDLREAEDAETVSPRPLLAVAEEVKPAALACEAPGCGRARSDGRRSAHSPQVPSDTTLTPWLTGILAAKCSDDNSVCVSSDPRLVRGRF